MRREYSWEEKKKEMVCNKYNMKEKNEGCSAGERRNIENSISTRVNREEDRDGKKTEKPQISKEITQFCYR